MRPRLMLADDHELLLEAFTRLLERKCDVVGTALNGRQLIERAPALRPDIIMLDIHMPLLNGVDAGRQLKQLLPFVKLVFLTANEDPDMCVHAMKNGASGYLLKVSSAEEFHACLDAVARGHCYVAKRVADALDETFERRGTKSAHPASLTNRQREVLQLLAEGLSMKQAAAELGVTARTVAFHKYRIMEEYHLITNTELLRFSIDQGLCGKALKTVF
jgi:DNA-binding NarL/FixJ family response regulator